MFLAHGAKSPVGHRHGKRGPVGPPQEQRVDLEIVDERREACLQVRVRMGVLQAH